MRPRWHRRIAGRWWQHRFRGGWAIGVVGDGDDSDHRRSSGGGEESRRWGGVGGAASVGGI
jgi:hypothetical protein